MWGKVVIAIVGTMLILAGCAPEMRTVKEICPGKSSVDEALAALQAQAQNAVSLKASGQCRLEFYVEGKKKPKKENIDVRLRVNPPYEIYLWGDKPLVPNAVVLGSNEEEFWLAIRPKEVSFYGWGKWSEQGSSGGLIINPRTLLEALGMSEVDPQEDWSLSNEGAFDILTKRQRGVVTKKIYLYSCEYHVSKVEFFDSKGQVAAFAELNSYQELSEGIFAPAFIKVTTFTQNEARDPISVTLKLSSIKASKEWPDAIFKRQLPKGKFKNVGVIIDGKWIEQPQ
jgi:hypothetical protein